MGNAFMIGTRRDPLEYGRGQVVTLSGELDAVEACAVGAALAAAAASNPRVVVDLTGLEFIDCCALGMLARVRAAAMTAGFSVHASAGEAVQAALWF